MIEWVLRGAQGSQLADRIVVATDDKRIFDRVVEIGFDVVMTSTEHSSGSDRVAEAVKDMDVDIVVNLQGDEPLIDGQLLDRLITELEDSDADIATPVTHFASIDELMSENTAKVVVNSEGYALYFSRAVIPHRRGGEPRLEDHLKHIGIYAYRKDSLMQFVALPQSELELVEKLEQLRALENGMKIKVVVTDYQSVAVDVPGDIEKVEKIVRARGLCS